MVYCTKCGKKTSGDSNFCHYCGAKLKDLDENIEISDSVIQRSQIGQSSVGNVDISPQISQTFQPVITQQVSGVPTCPTCGNIISDRNKFFTANCQICDKKICHECGVALNIAKYSAYCDSKGYGSINPICRTHGLIQNCSTCWGTGRCNADIFKDNTILKCNYGKCPHCNGTGSGIILDCSACQGTGICPTCLGSYVCQSCNGKGYR